MNLTRSQQKIVAAILVLYLTAGKLQQAVVTFYFLCIIFEWFNYFHFVTPYDPLELYVNVMLSCAGIRLRFVHQKCMSLVASELSVKLQLNFKF